MENHPYQNYQYQAADELNNVYPIHGARSSSYTPPAEQPPYYDYSNESYVDTPPVRENASDSSSSRSIRREKSRRNSVLGYEVIHHPGLNVLASLNRIEMRQKVEALEIMAGWETQNEYVVLEPDNSGQCRGRGRRIFRLMERSSTMSRMYLGTKRDMQVYMLPMNGRHDSVLVLDRPWRLWGKRATVYGPSGIDGPPIAKLKRSGGYKRLSPTYHISILTPDPDKSRRREIFTLSANTVYPRSFTIHRGGETLFDSNGKKAIIKKKWSGIVKEFFTDADNFVINFPSGATVTEKALLIACGIFIDLCFYETSPQQ